MTINQAESQKYGSLHTVESLYKKALAKILESREQLDALPKNPFRDDTITLGALRESAQIDSNITKIYSEDGSMILLGMTNMFAMDGAGIMHGSVTSKAVDMVMEYAEQRDESNRNSARTAFKREAARQRSPMIKTRFKQAQPPVKKLANTSILRADARKDQMAAYKASLNKRRQLERQIAQLKDMMLTLNDIRKDPDVKLVQMSADGSELRPVTKAPAAVYAMLERRADNDRAEDVLKNEMTPQRSAVTAAPAPRMAA